MPGKTIRLFLADGIPTGILTAEIMNWTGKVTVGPRSKLSELAKRREVKRTGIYLLVGLDPDTPTKEKVYVGESDKVLTRLVKHDSDPPMDFWTNTVVITSKDENLTKSHIRYLERRLIQIITKSNKAILANTSGTIAPPPPLPEPDVADMEYFLVQIQLVLPALGFTFAHPTPSFSGSLEASTTPELSPTFVLDVVNAHAEAKEIEGEFIVLRDSTARKQGLASWTSYKPLRDQLVIDGKLVNSVDLTLYTFTEDVSFKSPSAAAAVVNAGNISGPANWKIKDGTQTYAEWKNSKLENAGITLPDN